MPLHTQPSRCLGTSISCLSRKRESAQEMRQKPGKSSQISAANHMPIALKSIIYTLRGRPKYRGTPLYGATPRVHVLIPGAQPTVETSQLALRSSVAHPTVKGYPRIARKCAKLESEPFHAIAKPVEGSPFYGMHLHRDLPNSGS
jgi:hypothetical protein